MSDDILYEKIIYENEPKAYQLRLVLNKFKDQEYLHIRKYFLSFEEGFKPTKEGIAIPNSIQTVYALLEGLMEIVAIEEGKDALSKYLENALC